MSQDDAASFAAKESVALIETSALDSTNVDAAFHKILTGKCGVFYFFSLFWSFIGRFASLFVLLLAFFYLENCAFFFFRNLPSSQPAETNRYVRSARSTRQGGSSAGEKKIAILIETDSFICNYRCRCRTTCILDRALLKYDYSVPTI